jgi:hypothetical protein
VALNLAAGKPAAKGPQRCLCGHFAVTEPIEQQRRKANGVPRSPAFSGDFRPCSLAFADLRKIEVLGTYSNHDLQGSLARLARLARKLAAVRTGGRPRRRLTTCRQRPRRPGWVLRAIVGVLADHGEPMRVKDIHAAVETALGESVAASSIKTALIANATGPSRRLVRVAPGRYMLA